MQRQPKSVIKQKIADLLVLLLLAGLVAIYCIDAAGASTSILNLILVLPVTIVVLALCLIQFVIGLRTLRDYAEPKESVSDILVVVSLFAAYVVSLHWLGFDVGTCLFLGVFLWLHGERRWPWLFGYSISFAFTVSIFFSKMLPYPMPMLVLNSAY